MIRIRLRAWSIQCCGIQGYIFGGSRINTKDTATVDRTRKSKQFITGHKQSITFALFGQRRVAISLSKCVAMRHSRQSLAPNKALKRLKNPYKFSLNEILLCLSCDGLGVVVWLSSLFATLKVGYGAEGGIRIHLPAKSSQLLGNSQNLGIRFVFFPSLNFFLVSLILPVLSSALS